MGLPKIDAPSVDVKLPFTKKSVSLRPYTVKEEKILLFAQSSQESAEISKAINQVLANCIQDDTKVDDLPAFEVDFLFLKLRSISVNNIVKLKVKDEKDGEEIYYDTEVDLENVEINMDRAEDPNIKLNDEYQIKLRYPKFGVLSEMKIDAAQPTEFLFDLIGKCIESIYNDEDVFIFDDYSDKEQKDFVETLTSKNLAEISNFMQNVPQVEHDIIYDADGVSKKKTLRGIYDFFTFA